MTRRRGKAKTAAFQGTEAGEVLHTDFLVVSIFRIIDMYPIYYMKYI
jgi:hypothetical protein